MKNILTTVLIYIGLLSLSGCFGYSQDDDVTYPPYQNLYEPILITRAEFESSIELLPARTIVNSGKIYVKDTFLFINEVQEGFHIINNTNPENPENIGFLKVIGSSDMSIKQNSIYIDNASDLIALKFTDLFDAIEITKRIPNIFPNPFRASPDFQQYYYEDDLIIIGWRLIN
ncbi:hypothetical protein [Bizionia arctica]|uniref:LVIVD repeat-containing protein n=1 Tax=Bizionia arctica TaxID=1495645 RepID=A0A917GET7_9FLAO|nr:hypothetical protein [Bizionia arctica]GGG42743.1 hypothetical protein GCM10010976_12770 [Bizionia arctica]